MNEQEISEKFRIFGENVKKMREEKGFTTKELSEKIGIKESYLEKIENGTARGSNVSIILDIARVLKVKPFELCEGV